jgi:hypothetical protein
VGVGALIGAWILASMGHDGRMLLLATLGCWSGPASPSPPEKVEEAPPAVLVEGWRVWGEAGWDPLSFGLSDSGVEETAWPIVRDEAGDERPYDRVVDRGGNLDWFVPRETLAPGEYELESIVGADELVEESYTVLPYGADPAFDPANVIGRVYQPDSDTFAIVAPQVIGEYGRSYLADTALQIRSVDEAGAHFRIAASLDGESWCDVLRATGTLSPTGLLTWSLDALEVPTDPAPTHVEDLRLRLGFLADGSAAGGVEGNAVVDLAVLAALGDDPCDLAASFGAHCWDCMGDRSYSCMDATFYAGTLAPTSLVLPDDLPSCGVDLEETSDAITCDFGGSLCAFAFVPSVFLVGAALRRRRRRRPDDGGARGLRA